MATQIIVTLTDSLDERIKSGVETVTFFNPITGEKMEIELGEANRKHFANHLAKLEKYIGAAEVVVPEEPVKTSKPKAGNSEIAAIREWAKLNGYTIGDRGRIKAEIQEAYYKAQANAVPDVEVVSEPVEVVTPAASEETVEEAQALAEEQVNDLPEDADLTEVDELLAEATGDSQEYTDEEVDALLAEIGEGVDTEDDSE